MLDQISNKYLLNIIFSLIPLNKFLDIIKKSKKYQKKLNVSLFNYQSMFLSKLKINYNTINIDKFTEFIREEFKIKADKKVFEKIIEEKKKGETIIQINNLPINNNQELKFLNIDKDITWISDKNIIKLDFSGIISNLQEQVKIP